MKKIYAFSLMLLAFTSADAQWKQRPQKPTNEPRMTAPVDQELQVAPVLSNEPRRRPAASGIPGSNQLRNMTYWEQIIGYTTYDNQTNNSVQERVIVDNNDGVHATWMLSFALDAAWADRGTGYNSGQGFIWGEEPYERLEGFRTGWPDLVKTADNKEMIFCHTSNGGITKLSRNNIGSGNWQVSTVPTNLGRSLLWPRVSVDGSNVHLIALSAPSGLQGSKLNGVDGNLVYYRSSDNGVTWDIQDHIFDVIDSTEWSRIDGDSYAIHARGGQVSIAVFSEFHDTFMLNSVDNGTSWDFVLISDFAIPGYQIDSITDAGNDGIIDTLFTSEGTGAVHIDANGITHVFFGSNFILDDTPGDGQYSFFNMRDLVYWNSTFATDEIYVVATAEENPDDNDNVFTVTLAQIPRYGTSMASMSSVGEDASGNIYVVYSAADEQFIGTQIYRHIYIIKSTDFGDSWSQPFELTPDLDFEGYEYVFPSVNRYITDKLHITVQRDFNPGLNVRGDLDPAAENDIVYFAITTDLELVLNTPEVESAAGSFNLYPNPTEGIMTLTGEKFDKQLITVHDMTGREVFRSRLAPNQGNTISMDFGFLPQGVYSLRVGSGKQHWTKEFMIVK